MNRPSFLLPPPPVEMTPEKQNAFERLWHATPQGRLIDFHLPYPKWEFLTYLCETKELVLHGSQNPGIDIVEPRQANDKRSFSNQHAIYATTDGIWVLYFAILDRKKFPGMSLFNSCMRVRLPGGQLSESTYFFSITHSALVQQPWCQGIIYILPRGPFQQEAPQKMQGMEIVFPHWISTTSAKPVAKLSVEPQDFPFLAQIHGHNDEKLMQLAAT
ncbi:MAG TPA: hypothetical protein VMC62_10330, partial [Longilinea sp.]|nr:hypothetical protein [Longilinea sp.]